MESENMNTTENPAPVATDGLNANRKIILALGAALVLVAAGMYAWKVAAVSALENKLSQTRTELIGQARQLDARRSEEDLRLFSTPLSWAIRRELMASNLDQVDQYFTDLVKIKGIESAVLANADGKIIVASDRKELAETFSSLYPGSSYLQAKEIRVERTANGELRSIIPILGLNQQLGTLVLVYAAPAYPMK